MKLLKIIAVLLCVLLILFTSERFLFSLERAKLFGWWWMYGNSINEQSPNKILPVSERVNNAELHKFKSEITDMLKNAEQNSITHRVALAFAEEFSSDPEIEEQLIIVAHDHPSETIRCYWQNKLLSGHNLVIITGKDANKTETVFPLENKRCDLSSD